MFHTDTLWGFIGLDDPILDESQSLINLLTVVGSHLGSAYDSCHKSNLLDEKQNALQASIDAFQREQRFLQVLCQDYISVFFADLKKDYLEILKVDPEANVLQVSASEDSGNERKSCHASSVLASVSQHSAFSSTSGLLPAS